MLNFIFSIKAGLLIISTQWVVLGEIGKWDVQKIEEQVYGGSEMSEQVGRNTAINCFVAFWFLEWSLVKNVQKGILRIYGVACLIHKGGDFLNVCSTC